MTVVTRFAPSPTGYLHIGGARTALFNYLFARHMGGKFLIRIEDTDKERNTPQAVEAIFDGLAWLGLEGDEATVFQSQNANRHREVARALVANGYAYLDYTSQEEIDEARAIWVEAGNSPYQFRFRSPYRDQPATGPYALKPHTIRLRVPDDFEEVVLNDLVQGEVRVARSELDDMVLLRSNGSPTYHLAVVTDDHDMGVTHVIRGDDHLNNAFRQSLIYRGMGWTLPQYAHIPLIHDEDNTKLSKRRGAAAVDQYREEFGILAPAMLNYLARLGWGHGNDELFTMYQAAEWFDIKDVGRAPSRLDRKRLASINGHYIRNTEPEILARNWVGPLLHEQGIDWDDAMLVGAMAALRERSTDLNALMKGTQFLWDLRPIFIEEKAREKLDAKILQELDELLVGTPWDKEHLEHRIKAYVEVMGVKLGVVAGVLRAALTGSTISPPIFDVMVLLGMEQTLGRIRDAK